MTRLLSGRVSWTNKVVPSVTIVTKKAVTELNEKLVAIDTDLTNHIGTRGWDAHLNVTAFENGFITPELVTAIHDITTRINELTNRAKTRIPVGVVVPWNKSVAEIPVGWTIYGDANNRIIRGAATNTVDEVGGGTSYTIPGAAMPAHSHTYFNAFGCFQSGDNPSGGNDALSSRGNQCDLGCDDLDYDNRWGNAVRVTTEVTGGDNNYQTITFEQPFMTKLFIQKANVIS